MNYMGLTRKYRVNRPLTAIEKELQLKRTKRLNVAPHYQLSVIRMNSVFLETVDKWYGWKGVLTAVSIVILVMLMTFYGGMVHVTYTRKLVEGASNDDLKFMFMTTIMLFPVGALVIWTLFRESFAYTHYPIRFDRKNRRVHIFKTNGSAISANWKDIFFTLAELPHKDGWEVLGHILAPDKTTVVETFALSYFGSVSAKSIAPGIKICSADDYVHAHWEFIRRYMEEGPQNLLSQVQFCMPVHDERENPRMSIKRTFVNAASAPVFVYWALSPLLFTLGLFRIFAMRTSKIPRWPVEIETACSMESSDPFAIEGTPSGDRRAVFPAAAHAAGL